MSKKSEGPHSRVEPILVGPETKIRAVAAAYRDSVLSPGVTVRVAVEQASTFGWERDVGTSGHIIGMKTFGASAPLTELRKKSGFEPEHVAAAARDLIGRR